jgi:hypothetical protein
LRRDRLDFGSGGENREENNGTCGKIRVKYRKINYEIIYEDINVL